MRGAHLLLLWVTVPAGVQAQLSAEPEAWVKWQGDTVVIGGLITSTLLVLPTVYAWFDRGDPHGDPVPTPTPNPE